MSENMNSKKKIRHEIEDAQQKANSILLSCDMFLIHMDEKAEEQLLLALNAFEELNKNLNACFEDKK